MKPVVVSQRRGCHFENNSIEFPIKGRTHRGFRDVNLIEIPFRDENGALNLQVN
jgi:hypothetical protein